MPHELVCAGDPDEPRTQQRLRVWDQRWRAQGIVAIAAPGADVSRFELLAHKEPGEDGRPFPCVCRRGVCKAPVGSAKALVETLEDRSVPRRGTS